MSIEVTPNTNRITLPTVLVATGNTFGETTTVTIEPKQAFVDSNRVIWLMTTRLGDRSVNLVRMPQDSTGWNKALDMVQKHVVPVLVKHGIKLATAHTAEIAKVLIDLVEGDKVVTKVVNNLVNALLRMKIDVLDWGYYDLDQVLKQGEKVLMVYGSLQAPVPPVPATTPLSFATAERKVREVEGTISGIVVFLLISIPVTVAALRNETVRSQPPAILVSLLIGILVASLFTGGAAFGISEAGALFTIVGGAFGLLSTRFISINWIVAVPLGAGIGFILELILIRIAIRLVRSRG